ncbi:MAG: hypothetical protein LQ345_003365 [Seirophora villosa]|nr:MAG: hypothetical protein LQ345_003365 [Seirophora villosa]
MERSAKRISSIFSLGSTSSDKSSNLSAPTLSPNPSHSSRGSNPPRKPLPASHQARRLSNSASAQELRVRQDPQWTPTFGPALSPPLTGEDDLPSLNGTYKPLPRPMDSPTHPSSRAGSRPGSRPPSPSKAFLRPLTPVSDAGRPASRGSSRPDSHAGSRPSSPFKDFHRPFTPSSDTSRPASRGNIGPGSGPDSPSKRTGAATPTNDLKINKRKSWIPGKARVEVHSEEVQLPNAWIAAPSSLEKARYDLSPLMNFQRIPELWHESGDVLVYLHAREAYRGPSFRLDSSVITASRKLTSMAYGNISRTQPTSTILENQIQSLSLQIPEHPSKPGSPVNGGSQGSRTMSDSFDDVPPQDVNLYLPLPLQADLNSAHSSLSQDDIEQLIAVRNVFAFLTNQSLVATSKTSSIFGIFLKIADFLQRYEFSNLDGSTLGEEAATNFRGYSDLFGLADVRASREKTLEAIILGERMRSLELYNEGFVHGVGKYDEIVKLKSPKYYMITDATAKRLERATLDLGLRLRTVRTRLESFDFPSAFSGVANSTTSSESKAIRFKAWKASFLTMRRHVMTFYKERYGAWPPSAKSKKNEFEESGLNRILLQELYRDFSDLYDLLVNRTAFTTRSTDQVSSNDCNEEEVTAKAMRKVLDEYDRSSPPVQPPVPFDIPLLPSLDGTRRDFERLDPKKQKKENAKRLENDEINQTLMQSYNRDGINSTAFIQAFMNFERQSARGKSMEEIQDLRNGQWLFMYAVIQSLPLVVVDAPGLQWTKGVEYFLCEVPKGAAPWIQESQSRGWYTISGGTGVVSLPADIIDHGVDGIYRRSHCWQVAEKWSGQNDSAFVPSHEWRHTLKIEFANQEQPAEFCTFGARSTAVTGRSCAEWSEADLMMGNAESRQMIDQFVRICKYSLPLLSVESQHRLRAMVNQIGGSKRKTCRTKIQQLQQGDLRMSAELAQYLASWVNPDEFFKGMSTQFGTTMLQTMYVALRDVSHRGDERLRARMHAVVLFDLRLQSAGYDVKLSPDLDDDPRQLTSRFFSSIVHPLLSSEDDDVEKSIGIFLKFGQRMKALAMRNGGLGALAVIPPSLMSLCQ